TPAFLGWCRFISLLDTSTGRIYCGARSKPRGADERQACAARMRGRRFCRARTPEIEIPLQKSRSDEVRRWIALEFQWRAWQLKRCHGRVQFVCPVPPRLGPLVTSSGLFFVAPPFLVRAAARKRLSPLPRGHAMSKPASSRSGTETRWSSCAHPRYRTRSRDSATASPAAPAPEFGRRRAAFAPLAA